MTLKYFCLNKKLSSRRHFMYLHKFNKWLIIYFNKVITRTNTIFFVIIIIRIQIMIFRYLIFFISM